MLFLVKYPKTCLNSFLTFRAFKTASSYMRYMFLGFMARAITLLYIIRFFNAMKNIHSLTSMYIK